MLVMTKGFIQDCFLGRGKNGSNEFKCSFGAGVMGYEGMCPQVSSKI